MLECFSDTSSEKMWRNVLCSQNYSIIKFANQWKRIIHIKLQNFLNITANLCQKSNLACNCKWRQSAGCFQSFWSTWLGWYMHSGVKGKDLFPTSFCCLTNTLYVQGLTFLGNINPLRVGELVLAQSDPLLHARRDGLTCVWVERRKATQTREQKRSPYYFGVLFNVQSWMSICNKTE